MLSNDESFKVLKRKDIYEFLEGSGPSLITYNGTEYGMPYYSANQLEMLCTEFGYTNFMPGSRWFYVEGLLDFVIEKGRTDDLLLSFEEPTRFIFSHSALREGWDNPNVFQICTLKHGGDSTTQKRQEVGRGLRLCVNQAGDRMDTETVGEQVQIVNTLTVIASEGYATFVAGLQEQTRAVLYDRPRKASIEYFEGKNIIMADGQQMKVTQPQARQIYQYLVRNNYIDENDNVTQDYRDDVKNDNLAQLPEVLRPMQEGIHKLVQAIFDDKVLEEMF